ncbi:MAG: hypothetical protein AAF589_01555 [Planctomycetota bacterium]
MKTALSLMLALAAVVAATGAEAANPCGVGTVIKKVEYKPVLSALDAEGGHQVFTRRPGCGKKAAGGASSSELTVGSVVTAPTNFLGKEEGFVLLKMGPAIHECCIYDWQANKVTFQVPDMGLRTKIGAELQLVRPDGTVVRSYKVTLVRKPDLIIHKEPIETPSAGALMIGNPATTGNLLMTPAPEQPTIAK